MAKWLERAKQQMGSVAMGDLPLNLQIPQSAGKATAKTDERNPTAVTAVPKPGKPENSRVSIGGNGSPPAALPVTTAEEVALLAWLAHIEETDEAIIAIVMDQCRTDAEALRYFLRRAEEVPRPLDFYDDRRRCDQCAKLTQRGLCLAAKRGEIVANRSYEPVRDLPRRCEGYAPGPNDPDHRPGCVRWPGLIEKVGQ